MHVAANGRGVLEGMASRPEPAISSDTGVSAGVHVAVSPHLVGHEQSSRWPQNKGPGFQGSVSTVPIGVRVGLWFLVELARVAVSPCQCSSR